MHKQTPALEYGKSDWDTVRLAFFNSIMIDSHLNSLAQNAELGQWPIDHAGETPSKYVDFSWEEIHEIPGIAEHPERVDLLIQILKETLSFDDPFGDMVEAVEIATDEHDVLTKNLEDLHIPYDFPLCFSALSVETLNFCQSEDVLTVGEFTKFAGSLAQSILVGGDFKELLNALIMKDEATIARYLPFRPNEKGLHLIEALGLMTSQLSPEERQSLLKRQGKAKKGRRNLQEGNGCDTLFALEKQLSIQTEALAHYFREDMLLIRQKMESGVDLERCFVLLNNEEAEAIGSAFLRSELCLKTRTTITKTPPKKRGFFARLFGLY